MKATVFVARRSDIAGPQGAAVLRGVHDLGYSAVESVRKNRPTPVPRLEEVLGSEPTR